MDLTQLVVWAVTGFFLLLGSAVLGPVAFTAVVVVALVAITVAAYVAGERWRAERRRLDPRFQRTDEIFTDPATRRVTRVYVDPASGERRYIPEE